MQPPPTITHLERRKIEAGVLIPMIQAFQRAVGKELANDIARDVITDLARRDGEKWAQQFGAGLAGVEKAAALWSAGGSLVTEQVEKSDEKHGFNVTRCQYAEFFKDLGLPELGYLFHCNRDFAMVASFGENITLKRTQTIMEGASHCDFRFTHER
jgi:L-2-amino-thiazoline-4-carboxylic acid hydrolase